MKNYVARFLLLSAALLVLSQSMRADEAAYAQILKQREIVLSEILASRENRRVTGMADEDAILSAKIALWAFRRDVAASLTVKVQQQEAIAGLEEKRLASVESRAKTGLGTQDAVLLAKDRWLQAQQLLEELRLKL